MPVISRSRALHDFGVQCGRANAVTTLSSRQPRSVDDDDEGLGDDDFFEVSSCR